MLRAADNRPEDRHRPPAPRQRGQRVRARAACSWSPTGWAAPRPARSPRKIAIEAFEQGLPDSGSPEERLADRVREANRRIHELSQAEHERAGMGTTLTAAYLDDAAAGDRARRRQPRVPVPRRRARAPDPGPLARRGAGPPAEADRGAGRRAPAALDHHPRARPRADGRGRHLDLPGRAPATCCCCAATA